MPDAALIGAMERFVFALGGGLGLIVAAERHRLAGFGKSTLFLRWRTWAISAPLFALAAAGPPVIGLMFVLALSIQGVREYAQVTRLPGPYVIVLALGCVASAFAAAASLSAWLALPGAIFLTASLIATASQDATRGLERVAGTVVGFLWIPWVLGVFLAIKALPHGVELLLATGMGVALSDVCAFATGKLMGKGALAPRLSPAKTWAGAGGNLVGAYLGFGLMWSAFASELWTPIMLTVPVAIAVGCVWGDLFESLVKRQFGVKDTGTWLPGFGGLLDRVDSLLLVLPLVYGCAAVLA